MSSRPSSSFTDANPRATKIIKENTVEDLNKNWKDKQLPLFQAALDAVAETLAPEERVNLTDLWTQIRPAIMTMEKKLEQAIEENEELRGLLPRQSREPVVRPPTSDEVLYMRRQIDEKFSQLGESSEASSTVNDVWDLPVPWVLERLEKELELSGKRDPELGCWNNHGDENDTNYGKKNYKNTQHPLRPTGVKIGHNVSLHALAAIAQGLGPQLRLTSNGKYHVSHLCHNHRCFNPDHVVIETAQMNQKRKTCHGHYILNFTEDTKEGGKAEPATVFHPCPHGHEERCVACLLPRRTLLSGRWYDVDEHGEPKVRGNMAPGY